MVLIGASSGLVLSLSGYTAGLQTQPPSVALGIRLGMGLLPLPAVGVFLTALHFYPLNKQRVVELRERLDQLHREQAAPPTKPRMTPAPLQPPRSPKHLGRKERQG